MVEPLPLSRVRKLGWPHFKVSSIIPTPWVFFAVSRTSSRSAASCLRWAGEWRVGCVPRILGLATFIKMILVSARITATAPPSRRPASEFGIIVLHHPLAVSDQVFVAKSAIAQFALEERRQDSRQHREKGRIGAAFALAHEIRLVAEEVAERTQRACGELGDFRVAVTAKAMAVQRCAHALASRRGGSFRRAVEEMCRSLGEVPIVHPARMQQGEIELIFQHALHRPGERALERVKTAIEIDAIGTLEMRADESGIGDDKPIIVDEGQLALRRGLRAAALPLVGKPRHLELHFRLHHERTGVGKAESRAEAEQCDHGMPLTTELTLFLASLC